MTRLIDIPQGSLAHDGKRLGLHLPDGRGYYAASHPRGMPDRSRLQMICDFLRRDYVHWHWSNVDAAPLAAEAEVLATGLTAEHFASAATLEAALRARGVGHPAKVGDRNLQSKDLPGCCIVRSDYSEIAQVRSDRSYVWLHEAGESAYARVDDLTTSRWEVLVLHVPDDATPEQARALAGPPQSMPPPPPAVAVGDKGVPSERVPEGAVVRHPSGDVYHVHAGGAIWHIGDGTGPQDRASEVARSLERRASRAGWEILALGVPATATALEARVAAGLEPAPAPRPAAVADGIYVTARGAIYVSEGGSRTWLADHDGHPAERPDLYEAGEPCPRGHLDSGPRLVSGKPADDRLLLELRSRAEVDAALLAWPTTADAVARFGEALGWQRCFYNDTNAPNNLYSVMGLVDGRAMRVFSDRSGHDERNEYTYRDHARRGLWLSAAPDARTDFYLLRTVPEGDRARTLVRAARKVNLTGRAADAADVFRAAAAGAQAAQAPSWARDDRGALVAVPGGRTLLWWHVAPDGKRYAWIDSSSAEALRPIYTAQDLPRDAAQAEVLLDEMDEGEVAQAALLRPHTVSAARSVAAMLRRLRGGRRAASEWAVLHGHNNSLATGVAHEDSFQWLFERFSLSNLTLHQPSTWAKEQRWRSVLADDLTEAQARAFAARVVDLPGDVARQRYAVEAARHWHALGPERMTASPPAGHEWAAAGRAVVGAGPDLGELQMFGGCDAPPGTLALCRVHNVAGLDAFVWLRTAAGWAYLSVPAPANFMLGWPGDEVRGGASRRSSETYRVIARDLSAEEQAILCVLAHCARVDGRAFGEEAARDALESARKTRAWASSPEALDRLRGRLLRDLACAPWSEGWECRAADLPCHDAAEQAAEVFGTGHTDLSGWRDLLRLGLTWRYVRHYDHGGGWAVPWLRFADWRGAILPVPADGRVVAEVRRATLAAAVEAALAEPARGVQAEVARPHIVPGLAERPAHEQVGPSGRTAEVVWRLYQDWSRALSSAGLGPSSAGVYPYTLDAAGAHDIQHGGSYAATAPTLLAVVGATTEAALERAVRAVLPRLLRAARAARRAPGLVALGPETRSRLL